MPAPVSEARQAICTAAFAILLIGLLVFASPSVAQGEGEPSFTVTILANQPKVVDGQPVTFMAQTNPPGFEHLVQWTAVTRCGFAEPETGQGQMFTTVFFDTYCLPPEECRWLAVRANEAEYQEHTVPDCIPDIEVPIGDDCWETEEPAAGEPCPTKASFCTDPLPQDFFGPGSKQWRGEIFLRGPGENDTIIHRKQAMSFPGWDRQTVKIEVTKLDLESCQAITVEYDDGTTLDWDVKVEQSDTQDEGDMEVTRQHDNGGFFQASFPVDVKYTFTQVDDPTVEVILDTADPDVNRDPPTLRTTGIAPWVSQLEPGLGVVSCGLNFTPGVSPEGAEEPPPAAETGEGGLRAVKASTARVRGFSAAATGGGQCCVKIGHDGPDHFHVTRKICKPCPPGACYDKKTLNCREVKKEQCDGVDEVFQGMGTSCRDRDRDQLPDFVERNNCCAADRIQQSSCLTLSDPFNADTDGDGVSDGSEILQGRDPCTPG